MNHCAEDWIDVGAHSAKENVVVDDERKELNQEACSSADVVTGDDANKQEDSNKEEIEDDEQQVVVSKNKGGEEAGNEGDTPKQQAQEAGEEPNTKPEEPEQDTKQDTEQDTKRDTEQDSEQDTASPSSPMSHHKRGVEDMVEAVRLVVAALVDTVEAKLKSCCSQKKKKQDQRQQEEETDHHQQQQQQEQQQQLQGKQAASTPKNNCNSNSKNKIKNNPLSWAHIGAVMLVATAVLAIHFGSMVCLHTRQQPVQHHARRFWQANEDVRQRVFKLEKQLLQAKERHNLVVMELTVAQAAVRSANRRIDKLQRRLESMSATQFQSSHNGHPRRKMWPSTTVKFADHDWQPSLVRQLAADIDSNGWQQPGRCELRPSALKLTSMAAKGNAHAKAYLAALMCNHFDRGEKELQRSARWANEAIEKLADAEGNHAAAVRTLKDVGVSRCHRTWQNRDWQKVATYESCLNWPRPAGQLIVDRLGRLMHKNNQKQ